MNNASSEVQQLNFSKIFSFSKKINWFFSQSSLLKYSKSVLQRIMSELLVCGQSQDRVIPIIDAYNTINRNYQWESFKYEVPKHYHQNGEKKYTLSSKPPHKTNYIDDVLHIKKFIPAPNKYQIKENVRPLSGKMDKNPRKTLAETIIYENKREPLPGPGSYFKRPKTAEPKAGRNAPEYKQHYLNQVEYLSSEYPGVGQYNINFWKNQHVTSPKMHKASSINLKTATTEQIIKKKSAKKDKSSKDQLSKTLVAGTFDWIASQQIPHNKNYFGKGKRFKTGKQQKNNPGPNSYKLNMKWVEPTSLLKMCASTTGFKSVYYT